MLTTSRGKAAVGGALVGLALLALTAGARFPQTVAQEPGATPTADHMAMMDTATPLSGGAPTTEQMDQMMEQCVAMMGMMMGMMGGGDMAGMMGTPGAGMAGMEQMMAMMAMMMGMMGGQGMQGMAGMEGMQTPTATSGQ